MVKFLLGENKACKVYGIGTIKLKIIDDHEILFNNVRYVPKFRQKLLCINMFDYIGYCNRVTITNIPILP